MRSSSLRVTCAGVFAALLVAALAGAAHADADEASLHLHLVSGLAVVGDPVAKASTTGDDRGRAALFGVGLRGTYATSDYWAYQLGLGYEQTGTAHFAGLSNVPTATTPVNGELLRDQRILRVGAGASLRLGVFWIPTIDLWAGGARRSLVRGFVRETGSVVADAHAIDLYAAVSIGLDRRFGRHFIAGITLGALHAFPISGDAPYDAFEATIHASYYWYPRWFAFG